MNTFVSLVGIFAIIIVCVVLAAMIAFNLVAFLASIFGMV